MNNVAPFRSKHKKSIEQSKIDRMSIRMRDLEERVEQLIVLLSAYGKSYHQTSEKIMRYRKEGKI